jgi:hypothetical protein
MLFKRNKKGVLTFYIIFLVLAIFVIFITAVMAPFGVLINTEFYEIGEDMILDANETASKINDAGVRQALQDSFSESLAGIDNNIEVNNGLFQYSFIIVLIVGALFLFLYSRRLVEAGYGFV